MSHPVPVREAGHGGGVPAWLALVSRLSVVVPTRNERHNIGALLESLPAEVELVVVDARHDGTAHRVLRERPSRTRIAQGNLPIAPARQLGAELATGEWLLFTDADVRFTPGYFERLPAVLDGCDAAYGLKLATRDHAAYGRAFRIGQQVLDHIGIAAASGSNMLIRRDVLLRRGFRLDLPVNEDTELMLRLRHLGHRVRFAPELAVESIDDRRLTSGAWRKLLHSVARNALIALGLRVPLPRRWLTGDWGYWRDAGRAVEWAGVAPRTPMNRGRDARRLPQAPDRRSFGDCDAWSPPQRPARRPAHRWIEEASPDEAAGR